LCCSKQGSDDIKLLSSEAWIFHTHFDLTQGQFFRELCPRVY
jgi:hypothetical protein